ncbi:MAG: signal peptidase II [Candidatus Dasytiphilus stammeri]
MNVKLFRTSNYSCIWLIMIVGMLDFISKQWIMNFFELGQGVSLTPFLNIIYIQNYGVALNFFINKDGWKFWLLIIIQIILILSCILSYTLMQPMKNIVAWSMIIGGSLGNCLDRILHGFVIDFIDFTIIKNWHLPTFNFADAAICMGVFLTLIGNFP